MRYLPKQSEWTANILIASINRKTFSLGREKYFPNYGANDDTDDSGGIYFLEESVSSSSLSSQALILLNI